MKSSIALGVLVAFQTAVGAPLGADEVSTEFVYDKSWNIDSYTLFLAERESINVHSYAYLEGNSKEKINEEKQFTVLNYVAKESGELSEEILGYDADVVCLQGIASHEIGHCYYNALKSRYAHFYIETCETGISLVASKYQMENPLFVSFGDNSSLFDFVLVHRGNTLGHLYFARLSNEAFLEGIVSKIEEDYKNSKDSLPYILCGDLNSFAVGLPNFTGNPDAPGLAALLFQPPGLLHGEYSLSQKSDGINSLFSVTQFGFPYISSWPARLTESPTILCSGSAELSASQDSDGNASVGGGVTITDTTSSGVEYSAELSGKVERDSDGNTRAEVKGGISIDW